MDFKFKTLATVKSGEHLGANLDFYTITTTVDLAGGVGTEGQANLKVLNQVVSMNGQLVLLDVADVATVTDPEGLPAGVQEVTVVRLAIEHHLSWGNTKEEIENKVKAALVETGVFADDSVVVEFAKTL